MKEIIKLEKVKKIYSAGLHAINDVSFSINEKEHVLIYGEAGSGKSTLISLISGMEPLSAGKIFVLDRVVHEMNSNVSSDFRNSNFGIIQSKPSFMNNINLAENVAMPLAIRGIAYPKRIHEAKLQLKTLGLLNVAQTYPEQISTYEAQLVSIARALIIQPKILLLDDITVGLSEKEGSQILGIINDIGKLREFAIIDFAEAKNNIFSADRYFTLKHGRIQEEIS